MARPTTKGKKKIHYSDEKLPNSIVIKTEDNEPIEPIRMEELEAPLTPLQHRFVMEYIKDGNATQAARRAGCKVHGGTAINYKLAGHRLFRMPEVQKAIKEAQGLVISKAALTKEDVIFNLQTIAQEARAAGKFDAAVRSYEKLGEILGILNVKKGAGEESKGNVKSASQAFTNQGEDIENFELDGDIEKFLGIAKAN